MSKPPTRTSGYRPSRHSRITSTAFGPLTEHGKAEGYTLDKTTGRISKPVASFDSQTSQRSVLDDIVRKSPKRYFPDFVAGDREAFTMRRIWPGHFFMLMKNQ